ncbi:MAG: polysaccharide deacetylase family protein [Flavobacterium sp. MedPE-SWcel]|uniref:polysaccharide deacetylase family protein n=1 Tax=uncultured Flavobacterium sp. TaxID=165435 RepID=UPI00091CE007|nr:polysaccharide deacetylase family protein [uncultured Flavobacterium sp.]OIQ21746.1 MAG: polysaccharide deacetylase family protein [Flavobacterium sp. MedPE-SWcel]
MLYWVKTRWFIRKIFPNYIWHIPNNQKMVYLTFDDGPTPEVTEWVLDLLKEHNIKATFFCIGNNIEEHPDIFNKVIENGHAIGNHTFNHLNGWTTNNDVYRENTESAENAITNRHPEFTNTKLFRPPYGKLKKVQSRYIRNKGYKVIMWDVLSADFDTAAVTPEKCLKNVTDNTEEGSIIIFHDSVKASPNLKYALPKTIEHLKEKGFRFDKIN